MTNILFSAQFKNKDSCNVTESPIHRKSQDSQKFHSIDLMSVSGTLKVSLGKFDDSQLVTPLCTEIPLQQNPTKCEDLEDEYSSERHSLIRLQNVVV